MLRLLVSKLTTCVTSLDSIERSFFLISFFPHWALADSPFLGASVVGGLYPVQYKGIFGVPDQGQTLHLWWGQTVESGLRWWAHDIIKIWGGRSATSSPHHHLDAGLHSCVGIQYLTDWTRQDSCASLWSSGQDTHAFKPNKNQF